MSTTTPLKIITLAAMALAVTACSNKATQTAVNETVTAAAPAAKAEVLSVGTFSGRNDHVTTGGVSIVKTDAGYQLVLAPDFSLDGAPDPVVALGNNGEYSAANKLAPLTNKTGAQTYALPANLNPSDFSEAYIWCEKFNVSLGTAKLTSASYGS